MRKLLLVALSLCMGLLTHSAPTPPEQPEAEPAVMLYLHASGVQKYPEVMTE